MSHTPISLLTEVRNMPVVNPKTELVMSRACCDCTKLEAIALLAIADALDEEHKEVRTGDLTKCAGQQICTKTLAKLARIGLVTDRRNKIGEHMWSLTKKGREREATVREKLERIISKLQPKEVAR